MTTQTIYAVICENGSNSTLQLRHTMQWLTSYKFEENEAGELILKIPAPIFPVATGTLSELVQVSSQLFNTPLTPPVPQTLPGWHYYGDGIWAVPLSNIEVANAEFKSQSE